MHLRLTAVLVCLLVLHELTGCLSPGLPSGSPDPTPALPAVTEPPSLPAPSKLARDNQLASAKLVLGAQFDQALPYQNVGSGTDYADFQVFPGTEHPLAYAIYRVPCAADVAANVLSALVEFDTIDTWVGLANYQRDTWDWRQLQETAAQLDGLPVAETAFDAAVHVSHEQLLVAVVVLDRSRLHWLIAGRIIPPFIEKIEPRVYVLGQAVELAVDYQDCPAATWQWSFGAGVSPADSTSPAPMVTGLVLGNHSATLTAENYGGSITYPFNYSVVEPCEYAPQHLYAIPQRTQVRVGEDVLVTIATGDLPPTDKMNGCTITLLYNHGAAYVPGSFNIGVAGGAAYAVDGFWLSNPPSDYIRVPDNWIFEKESGMAGVWRLDLSVAPYYPTTPGISKHGEILNFRLKFTQPGTYSLGFLDTFDGIQRTFYSNFIEWFDISNAGSPAIVVAP